ncbi:KapM protein [Peniophora sp. CONT]|nr:KapM protein [Peniophora sp. CONT]
MEQETEQFVRAIVIAADPSQGALHKQAIEYLQTIQANVKETWQLALNVFVAQGPDGTRRHPVEARFFALKVLDEFLDNKYDAFPDDVFQTLKQALLGYISSEYTYGSAEASAPYLRNKFSHTLALFFLATYSEQWTTFFVDLFALVRPAEASSSNTVAFNTHVSLLFFHIVLEISGEVADTILKVARQWTEERHQRDGRVRDAVRERDAARINEAVLTIVADAAGRMERLRKAGGSQKELGDAVEVVGTGMRTFASYVGWVDINLTVTPSTIPLIFTLLSDPAIPVRIATSNALTRILSKGLKEPTDKLQLMKVLSLGEVLSALEERTRAEQAARKGDEDEDEESYREALGRLLNTLGAELVNLFAETTPENIRAEAYQMLQQLLPVMLRFMADEYDDTCSTVFPLLSSVLSFYKKSRKTATEPLEPERRTFLVSLLGVILQKMKWDEEEDVDDMDDDDKGAFELLRKDLRSFMDSVLALDPDMVAQAVRTQALETLSAYSNGASVKWNEAELACYLIYIYGEINKSGAKGRAAFVQAPAVAKDQRKVVDYTAFPLTLQGELVFALLESRISAYPHQAVAMQVFESFARYTDFFKVRKNCIVPALEAMVDARGLHNQNKAVRSRVFYLFYKFLTTCRGEIPNELVPTLLDAMRDVLSIEIELPESEPGEEPEPLVLLAEAASAQDPQLYLFESVGILVSMLWKVPEQPDVLLSFVRPLLDTLQSDLRSVKGVGAQDVLPLLRIHHVVMALGNIARGFPDFPNPIPEGYSFQCLGIFRDIAQAILVSLEAMKVFKVVRDASRFAFARIIATTGTQITDLIPPLMVNLLTEFEPAELVDFMNFLNLLIHRLQGDMFNVLDELFTPLTVHIAGIMSQPVSGTDDALARGETKRAYLTFLTNVMSSKLQGVYLSDRNKSRFEQVLQSILELGGDLSDPTSQKLAFTFLNKSVTQWATLPEAAAANGDASQPASTSVPGYERFVYDNVVPLAFRVLSAPELNVKDGQVLVLLQEIASTLQAVGRARKQEAYEFFVNAFLPAQGWPPETAREFTGKMGELDNKAFRKYFSEFVRSSRQGS